MNRRILIAALLLLTIGAIGMGALLWALPSLYAGSGSRNFRSAGERIYYLGTDAQGRPIPRTVAGAGMMGPGMTGGMSCVDCHGADGRGGAVDMMFGSIEIPDIRYSALTAPRSEDGTTEPGWSDADIGRAIVDGIEPNGQRLKAPMPRWQMTNAEVSGVIAYLKELRAR